MRVLEPGRKTTIHFDPGSRYAYSGQGIQLLQLVVETVTKKAVEDLKARIGIVIMTNSSNGEGIFKELLESLLRNTFTPIEWEGFTPYEQLPPRPAGVTPSPETRFPEPRVSVCGVSRGCRARIL